MALAASRRPFTIDEYHRMGEAGILAGDPRIELIAGTIVVREPDRRAARRRGGPHGPRLLLPAGGPGHRAYPEPGGVPGQDTPLAFPDLPLVVDDLLG